jgi:hypothetical protein
MSRLPSECHGCYRTAALAAVTAAVVPQLSCPAPVADPDRVRAANAPAAPASVAPTRPLLRIPVRRPAGSPNMWQDFATTALAMAGIPWSGSATAAATSAQSSGFAADLGIHNWSMKERACVWFAFRSAFSSDHACPNIPSAKPKSRIWQTRHGRLSRLLPSQCRGCCRTRVVLSARGNGREAWAAVAAAVAECAALVAFPPIRRVRQRPRWRPMLQWDGRRSIETSPREGRSTLALPPLPKGAQGERVAAFVYVLQGEVVGIFN